jgi:hypothetical protein
MTTFFLDLWQDLRAKRLWPIAVALLAATIAVPVLVFKPASSPPPSLGSAAPEGAKLPAVTLDQSSIAGSHLNVFKEKNPFDAVGDKSAAAAGKTATTLANSLASALSGGSGSGSSAGASGSGGGSTTTGGGSTGGSAPTGPDGSAVSPGVHFFTYTVDLKFGKRGSEKTYKSVSELDILPDASHPVISFYGVKDGKTAVFFLPDPAFRADGEGECVPSPDNCRFLYLKMDDAHNEATLSAQNGQVEYTVSLTGLHIKSIDKSTAVGNTTPDKSPTSGAKATAKKLHKAGGKGKGKVSRKALDTLLSLPALGIVANG